MKRVRTIRAKDKRIFRETADRTKAVNVAPKLMRGGYRL